MKLRFLRLRPFDTSTADGRSAERYRIAALGAVANVGARAASMLTLALAVYLAAPVLGPERFGIWAMFAALAAALSFLDLGMGNALINRMAHATSACDLAPVRSLVTGGLGWLAVAGLGSAVLLLAVNAATPWGRLLHLQHPGGEAEARMAGYAFGAIFGFHTLASGAMKILVGQQRSHEAHLAAAASALLASLVLCLNTSAGTTVAELLLMTFGVPTLGGLLVLGMLHKRRLIDWRGLVHSMAHQRSALLRSGGLFFLLQIATMAGWGLDTLILGAVNGAAAVAAFAVAQRLFQFASQPIAVVLAPLWPAYAHANAKGDQRFVRTTLFRSMTASAVAGTSLSLFLLLAGPWVIQHWTRASVDVPTALLLAMATWTVLEIIGTAFAMYLNGTGIVRQQVLIAVAFCCVAIPTKIVATQHFGAAGLVAATSLVYVVVVVGAYATVFRSSVLSPLQGARA